MGERGGAIELLHKIVKKEEIGAVLSQGTREAARKLGKGAEELSIEVKGLEVPMHDPRGFHGMGLAYMTLSGEAVISCTLPSLLSRESVPLRTRDFRKITRARQAKGKQR